MNSRPWFTRKRIVLPLLTLGVFAMAAVYAVLTSDTSSIILYNQTGEPLPGVRLEACAQTRVLRALPADTSVRWDLRKSGSPSAIELEFAVDPPVLWQGGFVAPRGGYRVTMHVWSMEQVEVHTQVSLWQRWIGGGAAVNE